MKPTHNLVVGESYEKDGEQKTRWTNIGVLMTGERDGKRRTVIKLNVVPVGDWDGFINVFPIEKKQGNTAIDEAKEVMGVSGNDAIDEPIDLSDIPF